MFRIIVINDEHEAVRGKLALVAEAAGGKEVARQEIPLDVQPNGQQIYDITLNLPSTAGTYLLKAVASSEGTSAIAPTISRRRLTLTAADAPQAK